MRVLCQAGNNMLTAEMTGRHFLALSALPALRGNPGKEVTAGTPTD